MKQQTQIVMGASSTNGTKAVIGGLQDFIDASLESDRGFGVYGYKTSSSINPFRLMTNVEVKPTVTGTGNDAVTTWHYTPIRYWDSNPEISYWFIAYWPYFGTSAGSGPYVSESNRTLTIHDIPNWQDATTGNDIMTSGRNGQYRSTVEPEPAFYGGTVIFNFSHILAQIVIKGYYVGVEQTPVKIVDLTLKKGDGQNFLRSDGTATFTQEISGNSTGQFSNIESAGTNRVLYGTANDATQTGVTLTTNAFVNENATNYTQQYISDNISEDICTWLTVPFDGREVGGVKKGYEGLTLDVTYALVDPANPNANVPTTTVAVDGINLGATEAGKSYVLNLKFNSAGGGIDVESIWVTEWNTLVNVDHDVFNW